VNHTAAATETAAMSINQTTTASVPSSKIHELNHASTSTMPINQTTAASVPKGHGGGGGGEGEIGGGGPRTADEAKGVGGEGGKETRGRRRWW
jgi:hypothetical protein